MAVPRASGSTLWASPAVSHGLTSSVSCVAPAVSHASHQQCLMALTSSLSWAAPAVSHRPHQRCLMGRISSVSCVAPAVSHVLHQQCLTGLTSSVSYRCASGTAWTGAAWPVASSGCSSSCCSRVGLPKASPVSHWLKVVMPSCKPHATGIRWAQMPGGPQGGPAKLSLATGQPLPH